MSYLVTYGDPIREGDVRSAAIAATTEEAGRIAWAELVAGVGPESALKDYTRTITQLPPGSRVRYVVHAQRGGELEQMLSYGELATARSAAEKYGAITRSRYVVRTEVVRNSAAAL